MSAWPQLEFLRSLVPPPDWKTDYALLASYSADPASLVAALLACDSGENEFGAGPPHRLADAVEHLRGRFRLVLQAGRFAPLRRAPKLSVVLDQFVREVHVDEAVQSWHPKLALVRYMPKDPDDRSFKWRLWIGSRNLTRDDSHDIGLTIETVDKPSKADHVIPGVREVAAEMFGRADLPKVPVARFLKEISEARWRSPKGIDVEEIRLGTLDLPVPPANIDELTIVSPFLDALMLRRLGAWGGPETPRMLLSTRPDLENAASRKRDVLSPFATVLSLDGPSFQPADPVERPIADAPAEPAQPDDESEEPASRGLHAKMLFWRQGKHRTLIIGSPNATSRAWGTRHSSGRNTEAFARLAISAEIEKGLLALLGGATLVRPEELLVDRAETDAERDALDAARQQVAASWAVIQSVPPSGQRCLAPVPQWKNGDIRMSVGFAAGELVAWPRGQSEILLPAPTRSEDTELIMIELSLGKLVCRWLQRAPFAALEVEARDRAAFAAKLGARAYLAWMRALLEETDEDGPAWDSDDDPTSIRETTRSEPISAFVPTLEELLRCWARNPVMFAEVDHRMDSYLDDLAAMPNAEDPEAHAALVRFSKLWKTVRSGLLQ